MTLKAKGGGNQKNFQTLQTEAQTSRSQMRSSFDFFIRALALIEIGDERLLLLRAEARTKEISDWWGHVRFI